MVSLRMADHPGIICLWTFECIYPPMIARNSLATKADSLTQYDHRAGLAGGPAFHERAVLEISAAIYFFVSLPSITVFQVVPSGDISNLKL
jgi:hypothetical protein